MLCGYSSTAACAAAKIFLFCKAKGAYIKHCYNISLYLIILFLSTLVEVMMYDIIGVPYPQMAFCIGVTVLSDILSSNVL